jgi:hypothetical protein
MTAPASGTFKIEQTIVVAWYVTNAIANTKISLCYDKDAIRNGNEKWIEVDAVSAVTNGNATYTGYGTYTKWDTSSLSAGTYYIAGYLWSGKAIYSHLTTSFTVVAPPSPTFRVTAPTSGTYKAGQDVTVYWTTANATADSKVYICYDTDKTFNGNEHWVVSGLKNSDASTAGSYRSTTWSTSGLSAGTYYVGGYLSTNGNKVWSHLTKAITVTAPAITFRVTSPASGTYTAGEDVTVYWTSTNATTDSKVCICYDTDKTFNGNEHWVVSGLKNSDASKVGNYRYTTWNTSGLSAGKYYVGGYLSTNGNKVWSHLTYPITIVSSPALTVDDSTPRSANAQRITDDQLGAIIAEAQRRLSAATGVELSTMSNVSVKVVDLPGNMLGEAVGNTIYIDCDAAGYGWFVDSTPADDSEFTGSLGSDVLVAGKGAAARRVDLLTTVMHEMSHVLGAGHSNSLDLMFPTLLPGERRLANEKTL